LRREGDSPCAFGVDDVLWRELGEIALQGDGEAHGHLACQHSAILVSQSQTSAFSPAMKRWIPLEPQRQRDESMVCHASASLMSSASSLTFFLSSAQSLCSGFMRVAAGIFDPALTSL